MGFALRAAQSDTLGVYINPPLVVNWGKSRAVRQIHGELLPNFARYGTKESVFLHDLCGGAFINAPYFTLITVICQNLQQSTPERRGKEPDSRALRGS